MSKAGRSIIMVGNAASHRALSILKERKAELMSRYPERYLTRGAELLEADLNQCGSILDLKVKSGDAESTLGKVIQEFEEAVVFGDAIITAAVACDWSGVFGGLWYLSEQAKCGLCVEQSQIPILQIAIELCDYVDESLFEIDSAGTVLMIVENGKSLIDNLKSRNIIAHEIGYTTGNNDKVVKFGEITRHINKVRPVKK